MSVLAPARPWWRGLFDFRPASVAPLDAPLADEANRRALWTDDGGGIATNDLLALAEGETPAARRAARSDTERATLLGAVYSAIRWRSQSVTKPELVLMRRFRSGRTVEVQDHPALRALRRVNAGLTFSQGFGLIEQHKLIHGAAYWVKRYDGLGVPVEFEIWDPAFTTVIPDAKVPWIPAKVRRYTNFATYVEVAAKDVVFFRHMIDPSNPLRGLSPVAASRLTIDTGAEAARWNLRFFDNHAMPGGLFTGDDLGPGEIERIQDELRRRFQGTDNAHRIMILEGGLKPLELPISHRDMQWIELQQWTVEDIARVMELSPQRLGDLRHGTFSNTDQGAANDWEMIATQVMSTLEELNEFFVTPHFGPDFFFTARFDNIPSLQEDAKRKAEIDEIHLRSGVRVINEIRKREGLDDVLWGATPIMPSTMAPLALTSAGGAATATGDALATQQPPNDAGATSEPSQPQETASQAPRGVRIHVDIEDRMRRGWERRLRDEMRRLFAYFDQVDGRALGGLTREVRPEDVNNYPWNDWATRHREQVLEELVTAFEQELHSAGYSGVPSVPFLDPHILAIQYASARVPELLYLNGAWSLTETTRTRVRDLVVETLENGDSLRTLKNRLRTDGLSFGKGRAETIARTETATALGEAKLQAYSQLGYEGKRWKAESTADAAGPATPCLDNQAKGAIRLHEAFPSGHMTVPAHPRCRCTIQPVPHIHAGVNDDTGRAAPVRTVTRRTVERDAEGLIVAIVEATETAPEVC